MSIITMPAGLLIAECSIGQRRYDMLETSDTTGHQSARLFGPPRWQVAIRSHPSISLVQAGKWEQMLLQLRGGVNHLAFSDPVRATPRGTMRGTLTLLSTQSAGNTTLSITGGAGQASKTLLTGDWLQIGSGLTSQLVKVMADATANGSGVISVTIEPPLRTGFASGTTVTWSNPICHYKQMGQPTWNYSAPMRAGGFALDLLESWT